MLNFVTVLEAKVKKKNEITKNLEQQQKDNNYNNNKEKKTIKKTDTILLITFFSCFLVWLKF